MERGEYKRQREESAEEVDAVKKLREGAYDFLDLLEDADSPDSDLATVMKSFEEEIAASSPSASDQQKNLDSQWLSSGSDLGYLLEASDDELGLPPAGLRQLEGPEEEVNQVWSLNDEIKNAYDALEFETLENNFWPAEEEEEEVIFDGGLFDSPNLRAYLPETTSAV